MEGDLNHSECEGKDGGDRWCPKCQTQLFEQDCEQLSPPRGMPSCKYLCTCPTCGHQCCCKRESPKPRPRPPARPGRSAPR